MATERAQHQKWYDEQVAVLVELGFDLADAERRQQEILDKLPPDADPATYVFSAYELWQEPSDPENVQDSRVAYLANDSVAPKWKRLPSARAED